MRSDAGRPPSDLVVGIVDSIQEETDHVFRRLNNACNRVTRVLLTVDPIRMDSPVVSRKELQITLILPFNLDLTIDSIVTVRFGESNCKREGSPIDGSIIVAVAPRNDSSLMIGKIMSSEVRCSTEKKKTAMTQSIKCLG